MTKNTCVHQIVLATSVVKDKGGEGGGEWRWTYGKKMGNICNSANIENFK